ncbi:MAG: NERD domain-containing protein [Gammaproteobacteria bacterium]|nr:NERD domain-containing protein [Gammaproteobacteria bacterium]
MDELLKSEYMPWVVGTLLLLFLWLLYRFYLRHRSRLELVLRDIAFDRINNLVIPNADDGEILIDHLLLTSQGLLILEIKDVEGVVFGSDKMQDWTVIGANRRYTFPNPQHGLYDRIAAVREIVRQVPVAGRILFLDGAEFTKGMPGLVATLDQLAEDFGEKDKKAARVNIEAFQSHWDLIRDKAGRSKR